MRDMAARFGLHYLSQHRELKNPITDVKLFINQRTTLLQAIIKFLSLLNFCDRMF